MNKSTAKKSLVLIGKIFGVHGVKGIIKLYSYAESISIFKPDRALVVRQANGQEQTYIVHWAKPHARAGLLALKGVTTRAQAEALIGSELFIPREQLPELEDGSYYWFDLIGLRVFTAADQYLGRIEAIVETGSNDVYVVKNEEDETLIPALESVVLAVDTEERIMRVELPEGL
ncbi:MAG: 16S rRNA processing protein RimM [Desulfobacterales bacterium]|nr:MAG: 16S rRNA processing protein RimM [Desulfobacterales bacterium]